MNKKGILVLRNIIEIILVVGGLAFLITACSSTINFSQRDQAVNSFIGVVNELRDLENQVVGVQKGDILLLEEETAVVYFEKNRETVVVEGSVQEATPAGDSTLFGGTLYSYRLIFEKPRACSDRSEHCLCLFQENQITVEEDHTLSIKSSRPVCEQGLVLSILAECPFTAINTGDPITCTGGFVLDRGLQIAAASEEYSHLGNLGGFYDLPKRVPLQLQRGQQGLQLALQQSNVE